MNDWGTVRDRGQEDEDQYRITSVEGSLGLVGLAECAVLHLEVRDGVARGEALDPVELGLVGDLVLLRDIAVAEMMRKEERKREERGGEGRNR